MNAIMILALILTPSTPEEFLQDLCENAGIEEGAEYWSSRAASEVPRGISDADSLQALLGSMRQLSVDAGPRTSFEDIEGTFRIEFGNSDWSWTDTGGNIHRKSGLTVVSCINGEYYWVEIPILEGESASLGSRERLISGIMMTFILIVAALIMVTWAKRRYS